MYLRTPPLAGEDHMGSVSLTAAWGSCGYVEQLHTWFVLVFHASTLGRKSDGVALLVDPENEGAGSSGYVQQLISSFADE